jgi:cytochrome c-type biogenesis protein CcmH/NrfG
MNTFWITLSFIILFASTAIFWTLRKRPLLFCSSIMSFSAILFGLYLFFGHSDALHNYFVEQQKASDVKTMLTQFKNSHEIIQALKNAIAKKNQSPEEKAKGYYLLGRLYRADKNNTDALGAFQQAHQINPDNFSYTFEYLQVLYALNNQQHTPEIDQLMAQLEKQAPENPELLDFLGYDAYMQGNKKAAVAYWEKLLPYLSSNPTARKAILLAIAKAQKSLVK